jgi:predicted O-linked N-acetylglucosamine transferase (SPINDLY family)
VGITEWIDPSPEDYVRLAVQSARVEARLDALRKSLRERLGQSPLMYEEQFVRDLENACRRMWRDWSGGVLA